MTDALGFGTLLVLAMTMILSIRSCDMETTKQNHEYRMAKLKKGCPEEPK